MPSHYASRMCLLGDAAVAIQPLTGAGAFKAFENARSLVVALRRDEDLDVSLGRWSASQIEMEQRLLETGLRLEQAFLWNTIDLSQASASEVESWWTESVRFPQDYSYLKVG